MNCWPLFELCPFMLLRLQFLSFRSFLVYTVTEGAPSHALLPCQSLPDFVAGLPDDMLLCSVRALSEYVTRPSRFDNRPRKLLVSPYPSPAMSNDSFSYLLREVIGHTGASSNDVTALPLIVFAASRLHLPFISDPCRGCYMGLLMFLFFSFSFLFLFFSLFFRHFCPGHISGTVTRRDSKLSVLLGPAV